MVTKSLKSVNCCENFSEKIKLQIGDLQSRNLSLIPVLNFPGDEIRTLLIPLGKRSSCIVLRVCHGVEDFWTGNSVYSGDTYSVKTVDFVDYYYKTKCFPFVIPTCHKFCGNNTHLLAENSFVIAAGSCEKFDDDDFDREYEVLNDKEIMILPKILETAIVKKFNLR